MAYGFNDDMVKDAESFSQRLIDNRTKAWDLRESDARTGSLNQQTSERARKEAEEMDPVAVKARAKQREHLLNDESAKVAWDHAKDLVPFVDKPEDASKFQQIYKYKRDKAERDGDTAVMDVYDDYRKFTPKQWQEELDSVKTLRDGFQNTPENISANSVEASKQGAMQAREQANETQAQGGRMDLQRLQNAGSLAVANARESDSGVTPLKNRSKELIDIARVNGFGNKPAWIKSSIPNIASSVSAMRAPLAGGDTPPEIDVDEDTTLTNSMADYIYRATLAEYTRQGELYKSGQTDTVPDINLIQDQIMEDIVTSGKLSTQENDWSANENVWNPGGKPPPVTATADTAAATTPKPDPTVPASADPFLGMTDEQLRAIATGK